MFVYLPIAFVSFIVPPIKVAKTIKCYCFPVVIAIVVIVVIIIVVVVFIAGYVCVVLLWLNLWFFCQVFQFFKLHSNASFSLILLFVML